MKKRKLRISYTIEIESASDEVAILEAMKAVPADAQYSIVQVTGCWIDKPGRAATATSIPINQQAATPESSQIG